ncbi:MAG: uridine kinase [Lachnospiraceae bacterium]
MTKKDNCGSSSNLITERVELLLKEKQSVLVAIDGRCASGKTTLSAALREQLSCEIIHMDDFFLPPEKRTQERFKVPGGNVDHERFLEEVMLPLTSHQNFSYRPYDCHTQSPKEPVFVASNRITVIEGAYSCHPALWDYYDLHIFLDIDKNRQMERILLRNGSTEAARFKEKWIPLEEAYFKAFQIKERCELCLDGSFFLELT